MKLIRIKQLSQKRNGGLTKVAADIGMSIPNLHRCINNNDMKASDLERVAQIFGVPASYFFDDETQAGPQHKTPQKSGDHFSSSPEIIHSYLSYKELQTKIETLKKEIAHLKTAEQVFLRQLEINHNYITLLEKQLANFDNSTGVTTINSKQNNETN